MPHNKFMEIPASESSLSRRKLVFGVGVNDANYITHTVINKKSKKCPYYKKWFGMLRRCYDPYFLLKNPTYIECYVFSEWLTFSVFKKWMSQQIWENMELDKDIKIIGNKKYCPNSCLFVSRSANTILNSQESSRGGYLLGVCFDDVNNKFRASCKHKGKHIHLGRWQTEDKAGKAYKEFKSKVIIEEANKPENLHIKQYLLNHSAHLLGK